MGSRQRSHPSEALRRECVLSGAAGELQPGWRGGSRGERGRGVRGPAAGQEDLLGFHPEQDRSHCRFCEITPGAVLKTGGRGSEEAGGS